MHQYANGPWGKKAHQYSSVPRQSLGQLKAPDSSEEDSFTPLHTLISAQEMDPQPQHVIWNPDGGYSSRLSHVQM